MKPEIKCRRAVVNLNLQEIQALNDYRIAYGRRGFKCARSAMEKVIEAWKVAGAENATTTKKSLAVGNAAKLREAVVLALSLLDLKEGVPYKTVSQKDIDFMKAALAAPARQCDVGTAEEQEDRYIKFCDSHTKNHGNCISCPACNIRGRCEFNWAQTPYEEGGVCQ